LYGEAAPITFWTAITLLTGMNALAFIQEGLLQRSNLETMLANSLSEWAPQKNIISSTVLKDGYVQKLFKSSFVALQNGAITVHAQLLTHWEQHVFDYLGLLRAPGQIVPAVILQNIPNYWQQRTVNAFDSYYGANYANMFNLCSQKPIKLYYRKITSVSQPDFNAWHGYGSNADEAGYQGKLNKVNSETLENEKLKRDEVVNFSRALSGEKPYIAPKEISAFNFRQITEKPREESKKIERSFEVVEKENFELQEEDYDEDEDNLLNRAGDEFSYFMDEMVRDCYYDEFFSEGDLPVLSVNNHKELVEWYSGGLQQKKDRSSETIELVESIPLFQGITVTNATWKISEEYVKRLMSLQYLLRSAGYRKLNFLKSNLDFTLETEGDEEAQDFEAGEFKPTKDCGSEKDEYLLGRLQELEQDYAGIKARESQHYENISYLKDELYEKEAQIESLRQGASKLAYELECCESKLASFQRENEKLKEQLFYANRRKEVFEVDTQRNLRPVNELQSNLPFSQKERSSDVVGANVRSVDTRQPSKTLSKPEAYKQGQSDVFFATEGKRPQHLHAKAVITPTGS